ncbi:response regulator transcription factor [Paenibacillus mesophilus]|uniref:response regulator transcription factor n=1 Tax=Paenibacillus mesophilus TaxID=2582849 RepID=UPI001EE48395|nr:response regulator [Paenibacillus mesophilus]
MLIAVDKPSVCSSLRRMVAWERLDAKILAECSNGKEALEMALEQQPDLIIADVRLPAWDGLELAERLHKLLPDVSLIVLTDFQDFAYARTAMRYGFTDYILKPLHKHKLDLLAARIGRLSQECKIRERCHKMLDDGDTRDKWIEQLKQGEPDSFNSFFESAFHHLRSARDHIVRDIASKLAAVLIEAGKTAGLRMGPTGLSPESVWERFAQAKTKAELHDLVNDLIDEVTQQAIERKQSRAMFVVECVNSMIAVKYGEADFSVYSIAGELCLSPNSVSAIYRDWTGDNISAAITRLRMEQARMLLRESDIPIPKLSVRIGYPDPHYFAKVFKKHEGLTPAQYRGLARQQDAVPNSQPVQLSP